MGDTIIKALGGILNTLTGGLLGTNVNLKTKVDVSGSVDVNVDLWERNKELFVLIFLIIAALIVSRL